MKDLITRYNELCEILRAKNGTAPARLDPDGTERPKTRIVSHPKAGWCVGPQSALRRPELEQEDGSRVRLDE